MEESKESATGKASADLAVEPTPANTDPAPAQKSVDLPGQATTGVTNSKRPNGLKRLVSKYWARKKLSVPLTALLLVGLVMLIPVTRYSVLGLFLKRNFEVLVVDASSHKPVSSATVQIGDRTAKTDNRGIVTVKQKVGSIRLSVTKKYYRSETTTLVVPLSQKQAPYRISVKATGRQVPVVVLNKISGKPLANALVSAAGSEVKTDKDGKAILVLPADKATVSAKISASGYRTLTATLQVTEQAVDANSLNLVTSGKLYFLSKQSGKIDVVKTNLDGTERETVLAGTGKENNTDTILLASRDWKYLALKSQRDGGPNAKLFLIDTATDKLTTIDEGNADFSAIGWAEHAFVFEVFRNGVQSWQPKAQAIKSYDAPSLKLTTIDETDGEGSSSYDYLNSQFSSIYILSNELVYTKNWSTSYYTGYRLNGKQISLMSVKPDGSSRKSIKDFPINGNFSYYSINLRLYEPQGIYVQVPGQDGGASTYYEYEDGKVVSKTDVTDQAFNDSYATYLVSPSGKQAFWSEDRDGKNSLFVGDSNGKNGKQIASLSEYTPYGWYSDDYMLVSKNSSELYIMPVSGGTPIKVTDYHKPDYNFQGYGYGYGGL